MDNFCGSTFWDTNLTWNTNEPVFTTCFNATVPIWIPAIFLIICLPFGVFYIRINLHLTIPWSVRNVLRTIVYTAIILLSIVDLAEVIIGLSEMIYDVYVVTAVVKIIIFTTSGIFDYYNKKKGIQSSGILFTFWLLLYIFAFPQLWTLIKTTSDVDWLTYKSISFLIYFVLTNVQFLLYCFADKSIKHFESSSKVRKNREQNASFLNCLLFAWFESTAWKGYRKPLTLDDIPELKWENDPLELWAKFEKYFQKNNKNHKKLENNQLVSILWKSYGTLFLISGILCFLECLLRFAPTLTLMIILRLIESHSPIWHSYVVMVGMCIVSILMGLTHAHSFNLSLICGFQIRSSLITAIYRKSLTIANSNLASGEIINLITVDANKFTETMQFVHQIWSAVLITILAVCFLWQILGIAMVAGLIIVVITLPLNVWMATVYKKMQAKQMIKKDARVAFINEILFGIKVLKCYAWERHFEKYVEELRNDELRTIWKSVLSNSTCFVIWGMVPFTASLASYTTYVLIDSNNVFNAEIAFVSLTLFNTMRGPGFILSMAIAFSLHLWVGIQRMMHFLNAEDIVDYVQCDTNMKNSIEITNGCFSWNGKIPALNDINLAIESDSLVAVVGVIGSGKTSLISSILGQIKKISGTVRTNGKIAYVSQQAWIQNATLQENVLFGKPINKIFYNQVLEACALISDLDILTNGDQTVIGENGVNLSGGQKQRVALARSVYAEADIYLLDDPLSAVDVHVGKHIFDKVIGPNGMLAGKCRLFVTHNITYLPESSIIYVMKGGRIMENGIYSKLLEDKGAFADFIEQHLQEIDLSDEELNEIGSTLAQHESGAKMFDRALSIRSTISEKRIPSKQQPIQTIKNSKYSSLMDAEELRIGSVSLEIYLKYMRTIGMHIVIGIFVLVILYQLSMIYSNLWLGQWTADPKSSIPSVRNKYLTVYGLLGLSSLLFSSLINFVICYATLRAAKQLHSTLLKEVLRLPMAFFDSTPSGTILNRFAKDIDAIDHIFVTLRVWLFMSSHVLSIFFVISYSTPMFLVVMIPLGITYYFIREFYLSTSRQLIRIESESRSPLCSYIVEIIKGQAVIRAFAAQKRFLLECNRRLHFNQKCIYPEIIAGRWIGLRVEYLGGLVVFFAIFFIIQDADSIAIETVGISLNYAFMITNFLSLLIQITYDMELRIISNERIDNYKHVEKEAGSRGVIVDSTWPSHGKVEFVNVQMRYRPELGLVLKNLTFTANSMEKIGVVGRTGAGKSSIALALFRIIECSAGSICIDDIDISQLDLSDLRSRLTIIPQDPILFSGSIRLNLDPNMEHTDKEIWMALENSHLGDYMNNTDDGLDSVLIENGANLSVGQRQLFCLARALLRNCKILILDEATAAVDLGTDDLIQKTIKNEFSQCTVITIAHRINTILDSDRVLVMDNGYVVEFDTPKNLLDDRNSMFYHMASGAGIVA